MIPTEKPMNTNLREKIAERIDFLADHWTTDDNKSPYWFGGWKEEVVEDILTLISEEIEKMKWNKKHKWSKEKISLGYGLGDKSFCINCSAWKDTEKSVCQEPGYNKAISDFLSLLNKQEKEGK